MWLTNTLAVTFEIWMYFFFQNDFFWAKPALWMQPIQVFNKKIIIWRTSFCSLHLTKAAKGCLISWRIFLYLKKCPFHLLRSPISHFLAYNNLQFIFVILIKTSQTIRNVFATYVTRLNILHKKSFCWKEQLIYCSSRRRPLHLHAALFIWH
jgi:hypothetical protein